MPGWVFTLLQRHAKSIARALDFRDTARKAIEQTDLAEIEVEIKDRLAGPAFQWLEVLGGVLGFVIGILLHVLMPLYRVLVMGLVG